MGTHDGDRGLFILKRGSWQPVAGSTKVSKRPVSGIFERKKGRQTVPLDDHTAMTMINENLQPDESFAGRRQKVKSFGSKALISCRRDGRDRNRQPIST
jgi:hypothetical protein